MEQTVHEQYMRRALALAERGAGHVAPNPLVGAVLVKEGRIIGEGWHASYGGLHAERAALEDAFSRGEDPQDADLYVTLEPCCHQGKQPPCTEAVLSSGIRRVYVGAGDPNPKVSGQGIRILRKAGVEVVTGLLEAQCREQNACFLHHITTGLPLVTLKYAMSLDGKTASFRGLSRWITGEAARAHVHETRNRLGAILAGSGTVLQDDPLLTCRLPGGRNPLRVICDRRLRTPLTSQIMRTTAKVPTLIATTCREEARLAPYRSLGAEILPAASLMEVMQVLGHRGVNGVLLEGGGTLAFAALQEGIADRVQAYVAPLLLGGAEAKTPVEGQGFPAPDLGVRLYDTRISRLGEDFLIEGKIRKKAPEADPDLQTEGGESHVHGTH